MSFVLCHDCYTWVVPDDNRCPECLLVMDLSEADPPAGQLRSVMGEIVERLGEVRIPRRLLPEWGTLYATTRGLFFVPHETDTARTTAPAPLLGASLAWGLASLLWSPLLFLLPFARTEVPQETALRVLRPRYLSPEASDLMPELLMGNPGAFFLPKHHIQGIFRKRSRWMIERSGGGRLQFFPVDSARDFGNKLSLLLIAADWQIAGN